MARTDRTAKGAPRPAASKIPDVLSVTPELLAALDLACIDTYGHLCVDAAGELAPAGEHRYRATHLQPGGEAGCVVMFRRIASRGGS